MIHQEARGFVGNINLIHDIILLRFMKQETKEKGSNVNQIQDGNIKMKKLKKMEKRIEKNQMKNIIVKIVVNVKYII